MDMTVYWTILGVELVAYIAIVQYMSKKFFCIKQ